MKLTASEFISEAEGLKSSEMKMRQRLESIRVHRQSIQGAIATQKFRLQSLYLKLRALESEAAGDNKDGEGTDNSSEIAAVMAEISSTQKLINEYEQQDMELRNEEMEADSELRSIEQQEQETLVDIQDSAIRTNQNITLISSFGGDYANVSVQAAGSFQQNVGKLSQAAQILGGNVAIGASGSDGGSSKNKFVSGGISSGGTGSGRNFYEAANNQRKTNSTSSGSMGSKGAGTTSTGRNRKDLYGPETIKEDNQPKKKGGFGRKPCTDSKQSQIDALTNYMSIHNYSKADFPIYSMDPEWRVLQKAAFPDYQVPPMNSQKAFALLNQYMASHNYSLYDYNTYSKDPIWRELHENAYPSDSISPVREKNKTSTSSHIRYNEFGVQSIESVQNWINTINPNPHKDPRREVNCGKCAAAVFMRLNGDQTASAGLGTYSIAEMNKMTGRTQTTMTPEQIKNYLISQGPGSHAVVGVDRASGAGHWFNAYYDGHQVYTIEGQGGEISGWPPDYGDVVHWDVSI